jgi:hypothetical protein
MKKYMALFAIIFTFADARAQNSGAIMIPNVVYVGDPAVLVLPLPASIKNSDDIILTSLSPDIPKDNNIDFHRIALERRVTSSRLLIEFTAFVPGYLKLPDIEIGGEHFSGLSVNINSVVDTRKSLQLSGHAASLAMPGTAMILYGAMAAVVFFLLLLLWFFLKGRVLFELWAEKWKRQRLFTFIRNMEKRLQKALQKDENKRTILDKISGMFREFLSVLTNTDCRAMTAREFSRLPEAIIPNDGFLDKFFHKCDRLRFSGEDVDARDISGLLNDLHNYIEVLYSRDKETIQNV